MSSLNSDRCDALAEEPSTATLQNTVENRKQMCNLLNPTVLGGDKNLNLRVFLYSRETSGSRDRRNSNGMI